MVNCKENEWLRSSTSDHKPNITHVVSSIMPTSCVKVFRYHPMPSVPQVTSLYLSEFSSLISLVVTI